MRSLRLVRNTLLAAAIAASACAGAWLARVSLQQDFAAYFVAGAARRAQLDPYVNYAGAPGREGLWDGVAVFAHSRFLYPPLVAELFRPLATLPYAWAKALFTAAALALFVAAAVASALMFNRGARAEPALTVLAGALSFPLFIHLDRGQIDLAALALLLAAWALAARPLAAGAALAGAALLKPALAGLVPIVAALGRWRAAASAIACAAALAALTAAVSGPGLLVEYATVVLPRAARFGEGGTPDMLLPAERLGAAIEGEVDTRRFTLSAWDGPVSASLPRLLSPDGPTPLTSALPALAALGGLAVAAREARRRRRPPTAQALLFFAAAVACVVTSPAGWAMGLVAALPLVPLLAAGRREGTVGRRAGSALGVALVACACPPLFAGWPALAGAALVVTAAIAAVDAP